ncbi:glycosyltransferase family 4 protein [Halomarina litorea]|uniref:glycosyltransferase family 4 protein n=1 Tax=Halomarina litorea TaxID=2961595 RepID=UPI0020C53BA2|nr:glycosyltransferase family 4 protein [Halomarina sp. BCD28]
MSGIGLIRVPPNNPDRDPSKDDIENIIDLALDNGIPVTVFSKNINHRPNVDVIPIEKKNWNTTIGGLLSNLWFQIELTYYIIRRRSYLSDTIWHAGGFSLILPILVSKILGVSVAICVIGEPRNAYNQGSKMDRYLLSNLTLMTELISFTVSDNILTFTESMADYSILSLYRNKIVSLPYNYQRVKRNECKVEKIVFLGRVCRLKGADRFADAVEFLSKSGYNKYEFVIIGDGPLLSQLSDRFENDPNVRIEGWVPHSEAMAELSNSMLVVLPSRSEGLPKSILEGMSHGTVPVVTPVGDLSGLVRDGENGFIVDSSVPNGTARAICRALSEDTEYKRISEEAIKTIERRYSLDTVSDEFHDIFVE